MSENININGKNYVVSLDWDSLPGLAGAKKEIAEKLKAKEDKSLAFAVMVQSSGYTSVGFLNKPGKYDSAAAFLSASNIMRNQGQAQAEEWVVIEPLDGGRYWFCAVKDGIPVNGTDVVVDYDEALQKAKDLAELQGVFKFYSPDSAMQEALKELTEVQEQGFAQLTEGCTHKTKYQRVKGFNPVIFVVVGSFFLIGGAVFWYQYNQQKIKEAQQLAAQQQAAAEAVAAAARTKAEAIVNYGKVLKQVMDDAEKQALSTIGVDNQTVIKTWLNAIYPLPLTQAGWKYTSIECGLKSCAVVLSKAENTNYANLAKIIPEVKFNGNSATFTIQLPPIPVASLSRDQVVGFRQILLNEISTLQNLATPGIEISYNIEDPKQIIKKISILNFSNSDVKDLTDAKPELAPVGAVRVLETGWYTGDIKMNASELWRLDGLKDYLATRAFGLTGLRLSGEADHMAWTVSGLYVLKKEEMPDPVKMAQEDIQALENPAPPPGAPGAPQVPPAH